MAADFKQITSSGHGDHAVLWTFNFPDGMTGTHYFTGTWYAPCGYIYGPCDGPTNTVIETFTVTVQVTFV